MTAAFTHLLNQVATYWPPSGSDGFGGSGFGAPVPIKCRWQSGLSLQRTHPGQFELGSSVVYVDRKLATKGYLALGNHSLVTNPKSLPDACQVVVRFESPSLSADETFYKTVVSAPNVKD